MVNVSVMVKGAGGQPIIFLDVDGVLHGPSPTIEETAEWVENKSGLFNKGIRLKQLLDASGARIVLSSSWRREPAMLDMLTDMFDSYWGIHVDDATPYFGPGTPRELEIASWFKDNGVDPSSLNWVAIDDENLKELPEENFVHCKDPQKGLTPTLLKEALAKLK